MHHNYFTKHFSLGFLGPSATFVALGYIGCDTFVALGLCGAGIFLSGAAIIGYGDAHLHLAPNFAGKIYY